MVNYLMIQLLQQLCSNKVLYKALDKEGIKYEKTAVGDKYVNENMVKMVIVLVENNQDISFSLNMPQQEMVF